jgi:hypothetical protein
VTGAKYGNTWKLITKHFRPLLKPDFARSMIPTFVRETRAWLAEEVREDIEFTGNEFMSKLSKLTFGMMAKAIYGTLNEEEMVELWNLTGLHLKFFNAIWKDPFTKLPGYALMPTSFNAYLYEFLSKWKSFNGRQLAKALVNNSDSGDLIKQTAESLQGELMEISLDAVRIVPL